MMKWADIGHIVTYHGSHNPSNLSLAARRRSRSRGPAGEEEVTGSASWGMAGRVQECQEETGEILTDLARANSRPLNIAVKYKSQNQIENYLLFISRMTRYDCPDYSSLIWYWGVYFSCLTGWGESRQAQTHSWDFKFRVGQPESSWRTRGAQVSHQEPQWVQQDVRGCHP